MVRAQLLCAGHTHLHSNREHHITKWLAPGLPNALQASGEHLLVRLRRRARQLVLERDVVRPENSHAQVHGELRVAAEPLSENLHRVVQRKTERPADVARAHATLLPRVIPDQVLQQELHLSDCPPKRDDVQPLDRNVISETTVRVRRSRHCATQIAAGAPHGLLGVTLKAN